MRRSLIIGLFGAILVTLGGCETSQKTATVSAPAKSQLSASVSSSAAKSSAPAESAAAKVAAPASPLVDQVTPGDEANETAHNQKGENTGTGDWTDRTYRDSPDGWFSWDLKVVPNQPNDLLITYAGVDKRRFNILVDDKLLSDATQPGSDQDFYEQKYTIPATMTQNKSKITLKFQSRNMGYAGGVFGVRVMRSGASAAPAH